MNTRGDGRIDIHSLWPDAPRRPRGRGASAGRSKRAAPLWVVTACPGYPHMVGATFHAWTKGEARAAIKAEALARVRRVQRPFWPLFGIPKGTAIERLDEVASVKGS